MSQVNESEKIIADLLDGQDVRENLSALRQYLRDGGNAKFVTNQVKKNEDTFFAFLEDEDPKVRKNSALLFGDLKYQNAAEALYLYYEREETLFARSAYLDALSQMDALTFLPDLRQRREDLLAADVPADEKKHVQEELEALSQILIRYDGIETHEFDLHQKDNLVLLTTIPSQRKFVCDMIDGGVMHPVGVLARTDDLPSLLLVRTYREILFPLSEKTVIDIDSEEHAARVAERMVRLCRKYHGEDGCFYFRIDCRSREGEDVGDSVHRLAIRLAQESGGALINSPGDYEVQLRLIETKPGKFFPCLNFKTLGDNRFAYRKKVTSASMNPSTAALLVELARPYLKEGAKVLDPFCGVGTMLIERDIAVFAGDMYGVDIFGDAIKKARLNASAAGEQINFITKNFFEFKCKHKFDEIVTDMPYGGKKTKEEMDALYADFFEYAPTLLADEATIVMYTSEMAFVKKQIRLHSQYSLLVEECIKERTGFYLMVMGYRA
ncbi:MAG: methyltransferase domain-containing protein [Clostridiales bacterium]|nr:methyltransferase domain-containing protein [Clostridiales bacterium]